jgi:hypothetical protein
LVPELYRADEAFSWDHHGKPDRIVYFANGFEYGLARETALEAGLKETNEVSGTPIRLATNRPIKGFQGLTPLR